MKRIYWFTGILLPLLVFLAACETSEGIGGEILGEGVSIATKFTDTLSLDVRLEEKNALNMALAQLDGDFLLGGLDDPIFGKASASICTQILLGQGENDLRFDSLPVLDSVVLTLAYAPSRFVYGRRDEPQALSVYELEEGTFPIDASDIEEINSDQVCALGPQLGSHTYTFPDDTVGSVMNIRLDDAFGVRILEKSLEPDTEVFDNVDQFLRYFGGIAIVPDENNTALGRFDMQSNNTRITFYYKAIYPSGDEAEPFRYGNRFKTFKIRGFGVNNATLLTTANTYTHEYDNSPVDSVLLDGSIVKKWGYLQAMAGLQVRIKIPHIHDLGEVAINSALLEINVPVDTLDESFTDFLPPAIIGHALVEADENNLLVVDDFGDVFTLVVDSVTQTVLFRYNLLLDEAIQEMLLREEGTSDLLLQIFERPVNAYRLRFAGPDHPDFPLKLKVYYTEL